jgi:hypothetical protein
MIVGHMAATCDGRRVATWATKANNLIKLESGMKHEMSPPPVRRLLRDRSNPSSQLHGKSDEKSWKSE